MPPRLLGSVRVGHRHIDDCVAFILRLIPGAAAGIICVAGVRIRRAAGRGQRIICRPVRRGRKTCDGADDDPCTQWVVAPTIPTASAPVAVAVTDIDVPRIDVVVAAARSLAGPSGTADTADATDTAAAAAPTAATAAAAAATAAPGISFLNGERRQAEEGAKHADFEMFTAHLTFPFP